MKRIYHIVTVFSLLMGNAMAGNIYSVERSVTSSPMCFDFLFGMGGSHSNLIRRVSVIENASGMAIGFDKKEVGDLSDLRTNIKFLGDNHFQVFNNSSSNGVAQRRLSTGVGGYVRWTLEMVEKNGDLILTSTSREGFGVGNPTKVSCRLRRL